MMSNQDPAFTPGGYDEPYMDAKQAEVDDQQHRGTQNNGYQPDTTQYPQGTSPPQYNQVAQPYPPQQQANQQHQIRVPNPQNPSQALTVQATAPTTDGKSSDVSCSIGIEMSEQTVTKIIKAVCFLATMISASLLFQGIKEKYIGSEVLEEVAYGVAASVIGLVLEVVTLVLHTQNMLSKVESLRQPILLMIFNIVSLILFFTSVIAINDKYHGERSTAYAIFGIFGIIAGSGELFGHIRALRNNPE